MVINLHRTVVGGALSGLPTTAPINYGWLAGMSMLARSSFACEECINIDSQPFRRDRPQAAVEVGTHAIKVYAEHKPTFACHVLISSSCLT